MKYIKPYFYDSFECKADKCSDSCCIGWEIDIDSDTYDFYKSVKGGFGKKLAENIAFGDSEEVPNFKLTADERCPFLTENGLCEIYINLGKDALCGICREHPRFYGEFSSRTECGLGLCCEKVCEMLFGDEQPLTFVCEDDGENENPDDEEALFLAVRAEMFDMLSDNGIGFSQRIKNLLEYAAELKFEVFGIKTELNNVSRHDFFRKLIDAFSRTEPINDEWTEFIGEIDENKEKIIDSSENFAPDERDYEKLIKYILYRHFADGCFGYGIFSAAAFAVMNTAFVYLCDCFVAEKQGDFKLCDRINNVKLWSKQIEYSSENTDFIFELDLLTK